MKAAEIFSYGGPEVIQWVDVDRPEPGSGQIRVCVKAAGVGPWDALVREGHSGVPQTLPLIPGSDIAGTVDAIGKDVAGFKVGDEVYGLTNGHFTGAYAEFALGTATSMARKPQSLTFIQAASAPVVAVTAWQMLFDYGHAVAGQKVLIHGAAGNVGAYAVQMARNAGLEVYATASSRDLEYVRDLGAATVIDYRHTLFEEVAKSVDIVIDTVGGETQVRSLRVIRPGGMLVSVVSPPPNDGIAVQRDVRSVFFIVDVTTARLKTIAELFDSGKVVPSVGAVLPLLEARAAHRMLAGAPHARGKIVLSVSA